MREYAKVAPSFWTGRSGRRLRGQQEAQIVAMYLMTCPHANMVGVYTCPLVYIAHETGLSLEGASKGLASLIEAGFCTFDTELELVWVHEMARFQVGDCLKLQDKRTAGVQAAFDRMPDGLIRQGFHARYHEAFHLPALTGNSPLQAPSQPLASQKQEQEQQQAQQQEQAQAQEQAQQQGGALPPLPPPSDKTRRIGLVCRLLRSQGVICNPAQFAGKYEGLERHSEDDFYLAVATLKSRGEQRIGIGLLAAVLGDIRSGRLSPPVTASRQTGLDNINYSAGREVLSDGSYRL